MALEFDANGVIRKVLVIKNPNLPQFGFEWHPEAEHVYVVHGMHTQQPTGEIIAAQVKDHGTAINVVQIWSRGYHTRAREQALNPKGGELTRGDLESNNRVNFGKESNNGG